MKIRTALVGICASLALIAAPAAHAADWKPTKPITVTIGFGPGGSTDTMGRLIAKHIEESKGWTLVVKNRGGGSGSVMLAALKRQKPDGYNLGMAVSVGVQTAIASRKSITFGIDDFDYLGTVTTGHLVLIAKGDAPYDDVNGLIAFAKKNGGATIAANGTTADLFARYIANVSGANIRPVPTKGGAESLKQVLGGHVSAGFDGGPHMQYLESGAVKVLGTMSEERHPIVKDKPTIKEQGFKYSVAPTWFICAPKGLPADVTATLAQAFDEAVRSEEVRRLVKASYHLEVNNRGPEGTTKLMTRSLGELKGLIEAAK